MDGAGADGSGSARLIGERLTLVPEVRAWSWSLVAPGSADAVGRIVVESPRQPPEAGQASITVAVEPDARGRGYGAEALRLAAPAAFAGGHTRLVLRCPVGEPAAAASALAAGFAFEGVERAGPAAGVDDVARFARLRDDPGDARPPAFARMVPPGVTDGVLRLRPLVVTDAEAWLEGENDELTVAWGFTGRRAGVAELAALARAELDWLVGTVARMAVVDVASGRFAGTIQLRLAGPPQVGGVGYVAHPAFRGRGYTTRALRLLTAWAFDVAGFTRLELGAKQDNVASQRAAITAGFEPDGVRRGRLRTPSGGFADEVRFALLAPRLRPADPAEPAEPAEAQDPSRIKP